MSISFAKHRLSTIAPLLVATLLFVPALASTPAKPKSSSPPKSPMEKIRETLNINPPIETGGERYYHMSPTEQSYPLQSYPFNARSKRDSLLQKIREQLDLNPPIATGGSRGGDSRYVCLSSPQIKRQSTGDAIGLVLLGSPTLVFLNPLNEVQIERDNKVAWQKLAKSGQPITGPIPWPLAPIQPDETVKLRLRPQGASGADFANITLRGAPTETMEANSNLVRSLGTNTEAWINSILQQLEQSKYALARAILFAPEAPNSASLDELRLVVGSCAR